MTLKAITLTAVPLVVGALLVVVFLVTSSSGPDGGASEATQQQPAARLSVEPAEGKGRGIPEGVRLQAYYGDCTIVDAGISIDSADVTSCDRLIIAARGVRITRSQLPPVDVDGQARSVVIEDSEIDGGTYVGPAVGYSNITVRRTEIRGAQHSVLCGTNCVVEDSWLHAQSLPAGEARHNNAFLSNGGRNVVVRGNTLHCTPTDNKAGGGCSGDLSLFGDFATVRDITIEDNLFKVSPSGFCARLGLDTDKRFGRRTTDITFRDNVFERIGGRRCGSFGAVTSVPEDTTWYGNRWSDGTPLPAP